jgi:hypothetical protein
VLLFLLLVVGDLCYFIQSAVSRTAKPWLLAVLTNGFKFQYTVCMVESIATLL